MSISIKNVILHQLQKNDLEEFELLFSSESLSVDPVSESLVASMHSVYNSKAKGYAYFKEQSEFASLLRGYLNDEISFYQFSHNGSELLKREISKYPFSQEGTIVFAEYQTLATDYLLISVISSASSLAVDDNLNLNERIHLEVASMDLVAQINLTDMAIDKDSSRYLSFTKGRVGRKVADFFLDFMEAEVGLNPKAETMVMTQAIEDYCSDNKLDREETLALKSGVADFCKSVDEVDFRELSKELPDIGSEGSFADYVEEQGYELSDSFPADTATIRRLTKFVGAGGGLNISFDSSLLGERIKYDPETDSLSIVGTPPNLRSQLTRTSIASNPPVEDQKKD